MQSRVQMQKHCSYEDHREEQQSLEPCLPGLLSLGGATINHSMMNTQQYNPFLQRALPYLSKSLPSQVYNSYEQDVFRRCNPNDMNSKFSSVFSSLKNQRQDMASNLMMSPSQQFFDSQHHQQESLRHPSASYLMYPPLTTSQNDSNHPCYFGDPCDISPSLLINNRQEKIADKSTKHQEATNMIIERVRDSKTQDEIRERSFVCLGINEDQQRLSTFLCFLRKNCIEVFRAKPIDVYVRRRSKKIVHDQVGIRCRFCAHLSPCDRLGRSSSFPSSIDRIYQSVTMMIREHFSQCPEMLTEIREQYTVYRNMTRKKDLLESKTYWVDSAKSLGMYDSDQGIKIRGNLFLSNLSEEAKSSEIEKDDDNLKTQEPHDHSSVDGALEESST